MDKNSPEWKKYKQDQADFKNTYQAELDKKHNIGTYTNTRNARNPTGFTPYKKNRKMPKLRTEITDTPNQIKYDKGRAMNDLGNKLLEVQSREGFEYDKKGNRTKSKIKGVGRRIYPDEGRHGEGGQTSIENPEFYGEKRTGLFGQKQKPVKETAVSEEKPLEELTDGELSEVEKLMVKKMAMGRTEGDKRTSKTPEDYEKPITQRNLKESPVYRKGKQTGTPIWDQGVKRPRSEEEVQAPEGNVKTSTSGDKHMHGSLGREGNAPSTDSPHWLKDLLPIATNTNQENQTEQERSTSTISDPNSADALEAKFIREETEAHQKGRAKRDAESKAKRQKYYKSRKKGGMKKRLKDLVTMPDIYPPDIKNSKMHVGYEDEKAKASKETEVECPHCSGEGRMAMSFGYGAGVRTCRNCGGKGKGTEFHYTDTEGNMKKSWQTWLESKKDQGQGDARYGNPHETGMEDPRKLQTTKDDFSMEEKKMLKKMHKNNGKPYIQIE